MKQPFQIPTSEKIENLIGEDLYYVWNLFVSASSNKNMRWNGFGTMVDKTWTYGT